MARLDLNNTFLERNDKGELVAVEMALEMLPDKPAILARPITCGEFQRYLEKEKQELGENDLVMDQLIVLNHCVEPKYDETNIRAVTHGYIKAIAVTILSHSGLIPEVDTKKKVQEITQNISEKK